MLRAVLIAGVAAGLWILYSAIKPTSQVSSVTGRGSDSSQACDRSQATCIAKDIIAAIQSPCTRAIESQLQYVPTWTNSAFDWRFGNPMWYEPPRTIIFHGQQLLATNGFGAQKRHSYFCVTTTSGTVIKAEIHDMQ